MLMKIKGDSYFAGCGRIVRETNLADAAKNCGVVLDSVQLRATLLACPVAKLGRRLRNPGDHKDVKNTDRSHDVYENKGSKDKITE